MTIQTKFDIGQEVWFMHDNKPEQGVVRQLRVFHHGTQYNVDYDLRDRPGFYDELHLFPSKAELLESL